jgi:hypothetical protein
MPSFFAAAMISFSSKVPVLRVSVMALISSTQARGPTGARGEGL